MVKEDWQALLLLGGGQLALEIWWDSWSSSSFNCADRMQVLPAIVKYLVGHTTTSSNSNATTKPESKRLADSVKRVCEHPNSWQNKWVYYLFRYILLQYNISVKMKSPLLTSHQPAHILGWFQVQGVSPFCSFYCYNFGLLRYQVLFHCLGTIFSERLL